MSFVFGSCHVTVVPCDVSFPGILLQLVFVMALDLAHAGCNVPAVTVSVHGSAFMMRVVDGAGRSAAVFFAGDVPAVPGILRLKRDAAASGSFDDEVSSADTV